MRILYLFILSLLVFSCSKQPDKAVEGLLGECSVIASKKVTNGGDTVVVCDASSVKESVVVPLSKLVDSLEIIRLESTDTAMVSPSCIDITGNYIGVNCYGYYKLFTKEGKYLADIGRKGQGPGEYLSAFHTQIDEENNRIYLMPRAEAKMYVYDLQGTFLQNIPLPFMIRKAVMRVYPEKQQVSVVQVPFDADGNPLAWTQDFEGRIIRENRSKHLDFQSLTYSNEVVTQKSDPEGRYIDFYLYSYEGRVDSLYHYDIEKNRCIPRFTVDFPGGHSRHYYYEFANYYWIDMLYETRFDKSVDYRMLIDKHTLRGGKAKIVIDQLGGIPLTGQNIEKGPNVCSYDYFIYFFDPGKLQMMIEEQLAHHKEQIPADVLPKVLAFNNSISEDDNCYILLGKWKK